MSRFFHDAASSLLARWLGSLAASFGGVSSLLTLAALGAAAYLCRKSVCKLAERLGIGGGPLLAGVVLIVAVIGLRNGWGEKPRLAASPGLATAGQERPPTLARLRQKIAPAARR